MNRRQVILFGLVLLVASTGCVVIEDGQVGVSKSFGSISDLFGAFFGAGGFDAAFGSGRGTRSRAVHGGDVAVAAPIDLVEAAHGKRVEVAYDASVRCETCHGHGAEQ